MHTFGFILKLNVKKIKMFSQALGACLFFEQMQIRYCVEEVYFSGGAGELNLQITANLS